MTRQMKHLALAQAWPDSPSQRVFGSGAVRISNDRKGAGDNLRVPYLLIYPGNADLDEEAPGIGLHRFDLLLVCSVEGDEIGGRALEGGPRTAGQGSSFGRGLLEVEEPMMLAFENLTGADGARGAVVPATAVAVEQDKGTTLALAWRRYTLNAWCTRARHYEPPTSFVATKSGANVNMTWALPPTRWDFHAANSPYTGVSARGGIVIRKAAGSTAPTSATDGSAVTVSAFATSVSDTPASFPVSYAIFAGYDEVGNGIDRYSAQETWTVRNAVA